MFIRDIELKMNKKLAFRFATLSGLTIGSFIGGIKYERNRCNTLLEQTTNPYLLHANKDIKKVTTSKFKENFFFK